MKVIFSLFCLFVIQIYAAPNIARPVPVTDSKSGNDAVVVSENTKPRLLPQPAPKISGQQLSSEQKQLDPKQNQLDSDKIKPGSQQQIQSSDSPKKVIQVISDGQQKVVSDINKVQQPVQREDQPKPVLIQPKEEPKVVKEVEKVIEIKKDSVVPKIDQRVDQSVPVVAKPIVKPDLIQPVPYVAPGVVSGVAPGVVSGEVADIVKPVAAEPIQGVLEPKKIASDESKKVDPIPVRTDAEQQRLDSKQTQDPKVGAVSDLEVRKPDELKDEKVIDVKSEDKVQDVVLSKKDNQQKVVEEKKELPKEQIVKHVDVSVQNKPGIVDSSKLPEQVQIESKVEPIVPKVEPMVPKVEPIVPKVEIMVPKVEPMVPKVEPMVPKVQPIVPKVEPMVPKVQPKIHTKGEPKPVKGSEMKKPLDGKQVQKEQQKGVVSL